MKLLNDLISRVRWNVVISMVAVIVLILVAILFLKPFSQEYTCSNGVCLKTYMTPGKIKIDEKSTLWVELRNSGNEDLVIDINLKTRNPALLIEENTQEIAREIELGVGESMKLNFDIYANADYPGTYRTDVYAEYNNEKIEGVAYLKVVED